MISHKTKIYRDNIMLIDVMTFSVEEKITTFYGVLGSLNPVFYSIEFVIFLFLKLTCEVRRSIQ